MKKRQIRSAAQPKPNMPGITRRMVRAHARRLFRDVYPQRPLTEHEWRLVEEDLSRKLERDGL
jgi:hypothetical protein